MGSTYVEKLEDSQRDLTSYFDKSATVVRDNFDRFEKQYGRPAINYSVASFDAYPLTSTFIAIISLLSLLPLITFLGFSLFFIVSIAFVAVILSSITIAIVEGIFLTILLGTFIGALFLALLLTPAAVSTYLVFRLAIRVRSDGRAGASEWASETKRRFIQSKDGKARETKGGSEASTGSGSVVVVGEDSPRSEGVKIEGEY